MSSASATTPGMDDVSIKLSHEFDEDGECGAFTNVSVDIMIQKKKVGSISAVLVARQRIPEKYFMSAMDGHSGELQWIGVTLFESRFGRTKLSSLMNYDDPEFNFMYIQVFHIDDEYKTNADIGASALRQLLSHPFIGGDKNPPYLSSAIYVLDPHEQMSALEHAERKAKMKQALEPTQAENDQIAQWARADANPFLRNGFFQDPAIARDGGSDANILVSSHGHWKAPMLTHAEAAAIRFCIPPVQPPALTGKDKELFEFVKTASSEARYSVTIDATKMANCRSTIVNLVKEGASLSRSHVLHAACANNAVHIVTCLLQLDPSIVNSKDQLTCTPLMLAAVNAAGRESINGIDDIVVIDKLIATGARTDIQDQHGMTAYGHFKKSTDDYDIMMKAMTGNTSNLKESALRGPVNRRLMSPGGPTACDLAGGEEASGGFAQYSDNGDGDSDDGSFGDY